MEIFYDGMREWLYGLGEVEDFLQREDVQECLEELTTVRDLESENFD